MIDIQRENIDLSQSFDVLCTTAAKLDSVGDKLNMSKAVAHEDFVPVHDLIRFAPGETTKVSQYNLKLSNFKNILKFTEILFRNAISAS